MLLSMGSRSGGPDATVEVRRKQPPADRLLDTAATLFDREGIRAVGIERLIAEADVARASLYQAFGSKDGLVVAYVERTDRADRERYEREVRGLSDDPAARIDAHFRLAASKHAASPIPRLTVLERCHGVSGGLAPRS